MPQKKIEHRPICVTLRACVRRPVHPTCTNVYTTCQGFIQPFVSGGYETLRGASSCRRPRVKGLGRGVPSPEKLRGSGGVTPGKFWNLRRNLVKSGAFWHEIAVSPAFHFCERKHCHSAVLDSGIDIVTYYFKFLVVWMPSVSCCSCSRRLACSGRVSWSPKQVGLLPRRGEFMVLLQGGVTLFQGEFSTPTGWLDKPLQHFNLSNVHLEPVTAKFTNTMVIIMLIYWTVQ